MKRILCALATMAAMSSVMAESTTNPVSLGIGVGIPYGGLGFNLSYAMTNQIELTAGLGTMGDAGAGKAAGVRYFFTDSDRGWRSSLLYGTNTVIEEGECYYNASSCSTTQSTAYSGLNISVGWGSKAQRNGWDFDLILILTSGADDRIDELEEEGVYVEDESSDVGLSIGYHWVF